MFSINVGALIIASVGFASRQTNWLVNPSDTSWRQTLWCVFNLSHLHKYPLTRLLIGMSIVCFSPSLLSQNTNLGLCPSSLSVIQIREYASINLSTNEILSRVRREVERVFPINGDPSSSGIPHRNYQSKRKHNNEPSSLDSPSFRNSELETNLTTVSC